MMEDIGYYPIGPIPTITESLSILKVDQIGRAIVDINLNDGYSKAIAEELVTLKIPFIYHTGFPDNVHLFGLPAAPIVPKPAKISDLLEHFGTA